MFVQIEDNQLKMNRGDTYVLPLIINEGTKLDFKQYQLRYLDRLYVGIMEPNQSFENALIRKVITVTSQFTSEGYPVFSLDPEDTEYLLTGKYFIEAKLLQVENGKNIVTTIMPLKEFYINGTDKEVSVDSTNYEVNKSITPTTTGADWNELQNAPVQPSTQDYRWISL